MPKGRHRSLFLILVLFLAAANVFAAGYIKLHGMDGSSKARGRENWIELMHISKPVGSKSLNFSVRAGTPDAEQLVKAARAGKRFQKVRLDTGKQVYEMTDAALIWIGKGGSANQPTEQISLSYEAIKLKY
jgi:type VI protein secretion system component Hcp